VFALGHTLPQRRVLGPQCRIVSFEPSKALLARLDFHAAHSTRAIVPGAS